MESIPIVDFSPMSLALDDEQLDAAAVQKTADELVDALSKIGFVYLSNTAFPKDLIKQVNSIGQAFFDLATDVKLRYKYNMKENFGYFVSESESLDETRPGDLKEAFNIMLQHVSESRWPIEAPDFKKVGTEFFVTSARLSDRVLTAIARGLHLQDLNFFRSCHHDFLASGLTVRMLHYPPIQNDAVVKPGQVRLGEHSDYGSITLLMQDANGGLQVKTRDGQWVDATPIPDTVLVNIGDMMQRWSSDHLVATPHRVLIPLAAWSDVQWRFLLLASPTLSSYHWMDRTNIR